MSSFREAGKMDEYGAWEHFAATGRVEDYLLYREVKNSTAKPQDGIMEDAYEIQYGRSDTDGTDNKGK